MTKSVTVSLEEDANLLNEVVIQVGYGTVKKKKRHVLRFSNFF
jgi:hypothetical protein